jgi:hypothetical protein
LLDGIAQKVKSITNPNSVRRFKYIMNNKKNTTIMVESKFGIYNFNANLVNISGSINDQTYPTK